jgi:drug/metabolite transporter (DMT)-like permease
VDQPVRAALYAVSAELLFATMGAAIKVASSELPNEVVVFFRNLFGLAFILPWLLRRGLAGLPTRHLRYHLVRALAGLGAMYCFFYALAHIPLAEAVLMKLTAPLFVPLVAFFWLRERLPAAVAGAVVLGFVGVALILRPGLRELSPVLLVALAGGVLAAVAKTGVRRLTRTEPIARVVFYFALIATAVSAVPLAWSWVTPSAAGWGLLLLVGLLATVAQLLMTAAYSHAPAAQVGPYTYTAVLFATAYGLLFWGETLGPATVAGAALVVAAGVVTGRSRPAAR